MVISELTVAEWRHRARRASAEAHRILATHESSSASRVIVLEDLVSRLSPAPLDVQSYFREAMGCLERGYLRAAVVMSWAGFIHVLVEKLFTAYEAELRATRPKWKFQSIDELKERYPESQLIDACREVGLIRKPLARELQGQLSRRNKCAHPTLFVPSVNSALGFVDDMIRQTLQAL